MKLLVDANLPPRLGRGLGELFRGIHEVQHIVDKFGRCNLADEDWVERLGQEGGWCVLSGDRRIATKWPSRQLFIGAGLIGFFPQPSVMKLDHARQASRILAVWHRLEITAESMSSGCFEIGPRGDRLRAI